MVLVYCITDTTLQIHRLTFGVANSGSVGSVNVVGDTGAVNVEWNEEVKRLHVIVKTVYMRIPRVSFD